MKAMRFLCAAVLLLAGTALWAWVEGERCLGQWSDGYWYPATVSAVEDGNFNVAFDDGDRATLGDSQIKQIDWGVGTSVECNWKSGGSYYPGTIVSKNGDSIHINYDDGDQEDTVIGKCRSN